MQDSDEAEAEAADEEVALIDGAPSDNGPKRLAKRPPGAPSSAQEEVDESCEDCMERVAMRYGGPVAVIGLTAGTIAACHRLVTPAISPPELGAFIEAVRVGFACVALCFLAIVNSVDPGSLCRWTAAEGRPEELDALPRGTCRNEEVTIANGDVYRWCSTCRLWKPPRCSHCASCDRCFLRYDHHCPWIGNCVGAYNHRFFASFVLCIGLAGGTVPISSWVAYAQSQPSHVPAAFISRLSSSSVAKRATELTLTVASSGALLGFLALCTTCYCGTLVCFGFASWVMLLCDTTTKERFGHERQEIDCEETCAQIQSGEWQREMRAILCGPIRRRDH